MKAIDFYATPMFPYPSGSGLHMGHFYNYAIFDSYCNWLRYQGVRVFQPIGFDAFGLPAENYAKKVGRDPREVTYENIGKFRTQIDRMNTHYEEMLITSDPQYVKVTQNIFKKFVENDLAYKKFADVDYCPSCETVLAKEQVKDGNCDRCQSEVIIKSLEQWFFRTTNYTQRLLDGLDALDWPESTKEQQRHWMADGKHRDWCVSRQRSWGCPIPIEGETDTLDTFVDSSFYTIAYCILKGIIPRPVDLYVGGSEHACMHLIYARFMTMALHDLGMVDFEEPFTRVIHQGMILTKNEKGETVKMSKSSGHVVSPDDYDQDVLRFYLMFIGHYFDGGVFDDQNIKGIIRFFGRWTTWMEGRNGDDKVDVEAFKKQIFGYTEAFKFNKVVSSFMEFYNKNKGKNFDEDTKIQLNKLLKIYTPGLVLQVQKVLIHVNIWDDYNEEKGETRMYVEMAEMTEEMETVVIQVIKKYMDEFITERDYEVENQGDQLYFRKLSHQSREDLVEKLQALKIRIEGFDLNIYSES